MPIISKQQLKEYLTADSKNYYPANLHGLDYLKMRFNIDPISDQVYIWDYIKTLRYVEYYWANKKNSIFSRIMFYIKLHKLRKLSRVTGFQIPPNVCGKGLTIWHWGPIIINPKARIGDNCTLYPGVLVGHKNEGEPAPQIGNNVFIGSGTKIIGNVKIGNNVTIGQNCVIVKDIPDNTTIVNSNILRSL